MTKPVVLGLKKKRSEISGQITQLRKDLKAIDGALKVFRVTRPDLIPDRARETGVRLFEHGELMALVGKAQRDGLDNPTEITKHVMRAKGVNPDDPHMFRRYYSSVKDCRKRMKARDSVADS